MNKRFFSISVAIIMALSGTNLYAQHPIKTAEGNNLNLDSNGVMAQGYDVVEMHTHPDQTIKGDAQFQSPFGGAKYYFSTEANKKLFDTNPAKYAPAFGGYCAIAAAQHNLRPVEIWTHTIANGQLVFNHNARALSLWQNNVKKNFKNATKNWPILNSKAPSYDILKPGETQETLAASSYESEKK